MTISLLWLNDYLRTEMSPDQLSEALTSIGLEVEKMEQRDSVMGGLSGIIAGKVLTCIKHPDADRLSVTTVDVGHGTPATIVCGASNIAAGQTVWVALPETILYDKSGEPWTIKTSKIRGVKSEGMICAEDELGLGENHEGIMILPDAVKAGSRASEYYKVTSDTIFEIGLTPNRSDATSILGVAEDLAAYLTIQAKKKYPVQWPSIPPIPASGENTRFHVAVRNEIACPRYSGVIIANITIGPSPDWMQKRLQSIGIKTINNVVDITNFVLHEMGQPLHAFDADKIAGDGIIVETKDSGTPFLALDGQTYPLYHEDLVICDALGQPMCIGGVYGGLHSGVTPSTSRIFLEAAHFNPGWVRRTSMRHNLRTEAARRFEKGSDPNITTKALARAVDLIQSLCGGVVASAVFDLYPNVIRPQRIELHYAKLNDMTGLVLVPEQVTGILKALSMQIVDSDVQKVVVEVPTNKTDVIREIDVIEEILRIYGFVNVPLPSKMHTSIAIEPRHAKHRFRRLLGHFLSSRGFSEMMNMSLTQPAYYRDLTPYNHHWVTIHNTSNESLNLLRPEMVVPVLETIKRNINHQQVDMRLYEFGRTYSQHEGNPVEKEHLVISMSGHQNQDHWQAGPKSPFDFFSLKGTVDSLLYRIGIHQWQAKVLEGDAPFAYGLEYKSGSSSMLRFGLISPSWLKTFDIRQEVFFADFDVDTILTLSGRSETIYEELNRFPSVQRDLAIIVNEETPFEEISKAVWKSGGAWLTNLQVFDIYMNPDQLGKGRKSIALRFTIENKEATLTDKDIEKWFAGVQKALSSILGAEIRKG
jgi:phenylalanyl-tRNA synthetase beta chain